MLPLPEESQHKNSHAAWILLFFFKLHDHPICGTFEAVWQSNNVINPRTSRVQIQCEALTIWNSPFVSISRGRRHKLEWVFKMRRYHYVFHLRVRLVVCCSTRRLSRQNEAILPFAQCLDWLQYTTDQQNNEENKIWVKTRILFLIYPHCFGISCRLRG